MRRRKPFDSQPSATITAPRTHIAGVRRHHRADVVVPQQFDGALGAAVRAGDEHDVIAVGLRRLDVGDPVGNAAVKCRGRLRLKLLADPRSFDPRLRSQAPRRRPRSRAAGAISSAREQQLGRRRGGSAPSLARRIGVATPRSAPRPSRRGLRTSVGSDTHTCASRVRRNSKTDSTVTGSDLRD